MPGKGQKKEHENVQRRRCDLQLIPYGHFVIHPRGGEGGAGYVQARQPSNMHEQGERQRSLPASSSLMQISWARRKKRHIKNVKYISCRLVTGRAGPGTDLAWLAGRTQPRRRRRRRQVRQVRPLWAWHIYKYNTCITSRATAVKNVVHTIYVPGRGTRAGRRRRQPSLIPAPDSGQPSPRFYPPPPLHSLSSTRSRRLVVVLQKLCCRI